MAMNPNLLKSHIIRVDGSQKNLAIAMGISLSRLNAKINESSDAEFKQGEIDFIKNRYGLSNDEVNAVFFNQKVSNKDTNIYAEASA